MEDVKESVKCIARIWRMCKKEEALLRNAMCAEGSIRLRKICCLGYMVSLIFRKELMCMYDALKCNLSDVDLNNVNIHENSRLYHPDEMPPALIARQQLHEIKEQCQYLLQQFDLYYQESQLLNEFICKLQDLIQDLDKELEVNPSMNKSLYYEVA